MGAYSLYLHIPFCRHKCSYCDFNTYAGQEGLLDAYLEALCLEARLVARSAGRRLPVHTVYFGGGTPSLVPARGLEKVLRMLEEGFVLQPGVEVSLEANPGTLSLSYLRELWKLGVNRLSLGMQSARPEELALLEREHGYEDVARAVGWARKAGFSNLNLDLIFGLPYQSTESWRRTLDLALALSPDHLSLYALTLEHGTPMNAWVERGLLEAPDPDLAAEMYETAVEALAGAGFLQYEISNWGRPAAGGEVRACRHHLQYWRNLPYLGLGAGAHGFAAGFRTANVLSPAVYIRRLKGGEARAFPRTPATAEVVPVDRFTEMQETLMMGFRLTAEGVSAGAFQDRFGEPLERAFGSDLAGLLGQGLLEEVDEVYRLTPRGRLLGNQVFRRFV